MSTTSLRSTDLVFVATEAPAPIPDLNSVVGELRAVRERWRTAQHRQIEFGGRELPAHFRETIEEYFKRLAQDGVK